VDNKAGTTPVLADQKQKPTQPEGEMDGHATMNAACSVTSSLRMGESALVAWEPLKLSAIVILPWIPLLITRALRTVIFVWEQKGVTAATCTGDHSTDQFTVLCATYSLLSDLFRFFASHASAGLSRCSVARVLGQV
jgi:hypothetical protein